MMKTPSFIALGGILLVFALFAASYAQIGEVAGPLNFNVSIGTKQSLTFTIINGGSTTFAYVATPTITTVIPNSITPTVTVMPMNGTIPPHTELPLNVTVYMPGGKNKAGMMWDGYISAVEVANNTVVNGAVIQAGTLKIMTITAAPAKFQVIYVVVAVVAVAVIAAGAYYVISKRRGAKKGKAKKAVPMQKGAKNAAKRATRKGKKAARGKKKAVARRATARRGARRKRAARR
jgi:predicted secreted protein